MRTIVLGSSSPYRKELLQRLHLDFCVDSPDIDETPRPNESISDYVHRLAEEKAREVGLRHADALIISSDQCATLQGQLLGKPGTHERACDQLRQLSGQDVMFYTGLCLLDTRDQQIRYSESRYTVGYHTLDDTLIEHYLRQDQPYHCTAAFRSEGLGVALTRHISGDDPSALIGLPLIQLIEMLRDAGIAIPPPPAEA